MGLQVHTEARDDLTTVTLAGELDIYTVADFRARLEDIDPSADQVVVDLSDVTLLDSSGIGALVSLLNRAREGDRGLGLVCPDRRLLRVFEITGLRRAFAFGGDLDAVRIALVERG